MAANFERSEDMAAFDHIAPFGAVFILNVFEHTFDPIYEQYVRRRNMRLIDTHFEYVGFGPVAKYRDAADSYVLPPPPGAGWKVMCGRIVHKALNTFGRSMFHPSHVAIGAVLISDPSA